MNQAETIGIVVIGLASILGLFALVSKPFTQLTEAINKLNLLVERLSINQDNTDKLVQKMDVRMSRAEKKIAGIELNCAQVGHLEKPPLTNDN